MTQAWVWIFSILIWDVILVYKYQDFSRCNKKWYVSSFIVKKRNKDNLKANQNETIQASE